MVVDITHLNNIDNGIFDDIRIEPMSESTQGDAVNLILQTNPDSRNNLTKTSFVVYSNVKNSKLLLGIICFEPNDVRTKFPIEFEDIKPKKYHEITYLLFDDRIFSVKSLCPILKQIFALSVNTEPIDEFFWFASRELYGKLIDKVFKSCSEYYFQNEANYFAEKIVATHNAQLERVNYINELKKKNAPQ